MFAMDRDWWAMHGSEVITGFSGARFSINSIATKYNVKRLATGFKHYGNSGAAAIAMAASSGATRVVLLGFDCQHTGGKTHWHGSHPKGLGDAGSVDKWGKAFADLARDMRGRCEVLNASRATALDCFERVNLEDVL